MGKNQDPGSGINIPDPPHCIHFTFLASKTRFDKKFYLPLSFVDVDPRSGI
jgi:hypothetical protein